MTSTPSPSLSDRVRHGVRWAAGAQYAGMVVRLFVAVALARLLGPAEFGVMALAMSIIGVAALVQESGLGAALVQHRGDAAAAARAMLLLMTAGGLLLGTAVWFGAPAAAAWLEQPPLVPVLRALAVACLLRALGQTPRAMLQRELRFQALATLELGGTIAYGTVGLALAASGAGLWSLVAAQLATEVTLAAGVWLLRPLPLPWPIERPVAREIARFGRPVMVANLLSLLHAQLPTLVAGRLLGAIPLGFYAVANRWASLPVLGVTHVAGRVAYPAFARLGDDRERLGAAWLRVLGAVLVISVPVATALVVLSDVLVRSLYDARWTAAIVPLQCLAFFGLFHAPAATTGEVFKAAGRPRWVAVWAVVYNVVLAAGLYWLVPRYGLVGLALAAALTPGVVVVGSIVTATLILRVPARAVVLCIARPLVAAIGFAGAALAARAGARLAGGGPAVELVAGGACGGAAYLAALALVAPAAFDEIRALAGIPRRPTAPAARAARARLVRKIAGAGLSVLVFAVAAEAGLRIAARGPSRAALETWSERMPWEAVRRLGPDAAPIPIAGGHAAWRLQPWSAKVEYRLDDDGFRVGAAPPAAADDATCRIVVLGDSNAFGYGLPADAALAPQLDHLLAAVGRPARVRNAGVCGANVHHLVDWTRRTMARTLPDVALIVLSPWSLRTDVPPPPASRAETLAVRIRRLWRPVTRWSALAERIGWYASHWISRLTGWPSTSVVAWELAPLHESPAAFAQRWAGVEPVLDELLAAAVSNGARPLLVWVPLDVQVTRARNALYREGRLPYPSQGFVDRDYAHGRRYQRVLAAWATSRDVPVVDVTGVLRATADVAFLSDDYHLSAAGYDAIARVLLAPVALACPTASTPALRSAGARSSPGARTIAALHVARMKEE